MAPPSRPNVKLVFAFTSKEVLHVLGSIDPSIEAVPAMAEKPLTPSIAKRVYPHFVFCVAKPKVNPTSPETEKSPNILYLSKQIANVELLTNQQPNRLLLRNLLMQDIAGAQNCK